MSTAYAAIHTNAGANTQPRVAKIVRSCSRNILIAQSLLLALLVLWVYASERYLRNCWNGPALMSQAQLLRIQNPENEPQYWVRLEGVLAKETGFAYVKDGKAETTYYATRVGPKMLLIGAGSTPGASVTGELKEIPSELRGRLRDQLAAKGMKFDDVLLPYMVEVGHFSAAAWVCLSLGGLLALWSIYWIVASLRRLMNPASHPALQALSRFSQPLDLTVLQINQELQQVPGKLSGVTLTTSWAIRKTTYALEIILLTELLWAYAKTVKKTYNGVPSGTDHSVVVYTQDGKSREWGGKEKFVREVLAMLARRTPWVIIGYSADIELMVKKNLAGMVSVVRARQTGVA